MSLSSNGTTVVAAAAYGSGYVRALRYNASIDGYSQVGSNLAAYDFTHTRASMSADASTIAVLGSRYADTLEYIPIVRVYRFNASIDSYVQFGSDFVGGIGYAFTLSLSADGTTIVVGHNVDIYQISRVRIFRVNALNSYAQFGSDFYGETASDRFGQAVSISADGKTIAVGALATIYVNGIPSASNYVRVFRLKANSDEYTQVGSDIVGNAVQDYFGSSVSISAEGTTIAVGAPFSSGNGRFSGRVRVYRYNASIDSYVQLGSDIDGEAAHQYVGTSVSISANGTTIAVSAQNYKRGTGGRFYSGRVRVYRFNADIGRYDKLGSDIEGGATADTLGYEGALSMSADGEIIAAGAPLNAGRGNDAGRVRLYRAVDQTNCNVTWNLFNSKTDSFVANISNGTAVTTPLLPPCNRTNIEAVVSCVDSINRVTLELYQNDRRVHRRVESVVPYFLFGDKGSNIYNGLIAPGTFRVRAEVDGRFTPFTTFTFVGPRCT